MIRKIKSVERGNHHVNYYERRFYYLEQFTYISEHHEKI